MKKGFSLIEVIAAIAIFSIGILAITLAFSTSLNMSKMNDVKRDTSQYAQVIIEKSKNLIDYPSDSIRTTTEPVIFYFYDIGDVNICLETIFNNDSNINNIIGYKDEYGSNPSRNKFKYGAKIFIEPDENNTELNEDKISVYHVEISVWQIGKEGQSESVREIYEGSDQE